MGIERGRGGGVVRKSIGSKKFTNLQIENGIDHEGIERERERKRNCSDLERKLGMRERERKREVK